MPKKHTRFIALDISTNTGYAIFDNEGLTKYGVFTIKASHYKADVKCYSDFPKEYPNNFMVAAQKIADECLRIIEENKIDRVVIEHPESAKQRLSQRLLEWTHYALVLRLQAARIDFRYLLVHDWRSVVNCYIKNWPEHQKWNQKIRAAKKKAIPTKSGAICAKIDGKRVAAINQKKLSIILANEKYGLTIKDDNIADAINLGRAAVELGVFALVETTP
jgi:hypothetical protein